MYKEDIMREKDSPALQALHQGIQTELQGLTFYHKAAERTRDPLGKQVLQSLAHEEVGHLHLLKVQYGALVSDGRWVDMEKAREMEPGREVEEIFPQTDDTLVKLLPAQADDVKALEIALEFERKGYQMYQRLTKETADPAGRAMYEFLRQQEQRHYDFIQRAIEYLKTQGAWYYDEKELPMFDGG
jgi:rubrerythrin